jgi:hypothetical protein
MMEKYISLQITFYDDDDGKVGQTVIIPAMYVEGRVMAAKIGQIIPEGATQLDIDVLGW